MPDIVIPDAFPPAAVILVCLIADVPPVVVPNETPFDALMSIDMCSKAQLSAMVTAYPPEYLFSIHLSRSIPTTETPSTIVIDSSYVPGRTTTTSPADAEDKAPPIEAYGLSNLSLVPVVSLPLMSTHKRLLPLTWAFVIAEPSPEKEDAKIVPFVSNVPVRDNKFPE